MTFDRLKRRLRLALGGGGATGHAAPEQEAIARLPIGTFQSLRLRRPDVPSDYLLILRVEPTAPYCWITVDVNGVRRQRLVLSLRAVFCCYVPWSSIESAADIEVRIDTSESGDVEAGSMLSVYALSLSRFAPAISSSVANTPRRPLSANVPASDTELLEHFVSFGENCEFGLYQRRHGVDGSSLLRLAAVDFEGLALGLQEQFAACRDPAELVLEVLEYADGRREYIRKLERYEINWHTLVDEADVEGAELFVREYEKLGFLLSKLVATLAGGNRIIVYKTQDGLSDDARQRLAGLLAPYGRNGLLIVEPAKSRNDVGTVVVADDGVMIGYIDKFLPLHAANMRGSKVWSTICRNALACWHASSRDLTSDG